MVKQLNPPPPIFPRIGGQTQRAELINSSTLEWANLERQTLFGNFCYVFWALSFSLIFRNSKNLIFLFSTFSPISQKLPVRVWPNLHTTSYSYGGLGDTKFMPLTFLGGWELSFKSRSFGPFGWFLAFYSIFSKTARYFAQHRTYVDLWSTHSSSALGTASFFLTKTSPMSTDISPFNNL